MRRHLLIPALWLRVSRLLLGLLVVGTLLLPMPARAQSGNTWRVDYYPNLDWAGAPVFTEFATLLDFTWGTLAPAPRMPTANWTATMTSSAFFYAGVYRFVITADDEFVFSIDGVVRLSTLGQGLSGKALVVDVALTQGVHALRIDFRQFGGAAYLIGNAQFLKNEPAPAPPPPPAPNPPVAGAPTVVTRFGDYTPCIQQGLHQARCFQSDGAWDSPNLGSIEMEPQILVWGNCSPNQVENRQLFANQPAQPAVCSRTEAGWFAR